MIMRAIIFDAFGTLFRVTSGGSAKTIMKNITDCRIAVDEKAFHEEWKSYYKNHTLDNCEFMTERDIFIARIQMFYDRYHINRNAENDADSLLAEAFDREAYPEVKTVLNELMKNYLVFIGSNTDNDVLENVMQKNSITVHKVYTSENLKCYKPAGQFFKKILDDNDLTSDEVLFVGDSITDDILGPKAIGIKTVLLDRNGIGSNIGQDYTITDMNELINNVLR
ncbi:MAG: HAD family hydrolase [Clostridia bacterium]|nr:HAD family hydrolase [Clostridia bacterium]